MVDKLQATKLQSASLPRRLHFHFNCNFGGAFCHAHARKDETAPTTPKTIDKKKTGKKQQQTAQKKTPQSIANFYVAAPQKINALRQVPLRDTNEQAHKRQQQVS